MCSLEPSDLEVFGVLKISVNLQENTPAGVIFENAVAGLQTVTALKGDYSTGTFLGIL